jgi:hypothetical protein
MAEQDAQQGFEAVPGGAPPPPMEKPGIFRHSSSAVDLGPVYNELNSLSARLRIAEERYTNLRKKDQFVEQNMLTHYKNTSLEIKAINADINEIKREIGDINNKIKLMINEFQTFAKKDEVKVIEKYVNLWEPLKNMTPAEVEGIVRRILERQDIGDDAGQSRRQDEEETGRDAEEDSTMQKNNAGRRR